MRTGWLGWLVALCAAGCATAPDRTRVAGVPEPPAWTVPGASSQQVLDDPWWSGFDDAALDAAVEEALAGNPGLPQALARVDAALALARGAGAGALPQLGLGWDSARRQQVFVGLPIPGQEGKPLTSLSTSHTASLSVSWELDVWGRIRAGQRAALADVQAAAADARGAWQSLAAQTVRAWVAVAAATRQLELAEATHRSFELTADQVGERYRRGIRTALDYRLALSNEAAARALVPLRRRELDAAVRQLEILLGRYPEGRLAADFQLPNLPVDVPAGLPSELLERRPDLAAGERRLAAGQVRVQEAKRALLPRISLTATGGRTSSDLEDLVDPNFSMWALAGNLAQPLLQGGRLRANVRLAEARALEALEAYRLLALRAFAEVEIALAAEEQLRQREVHLQEVVGQSGAALRLAEDRYAAGLTEFITLMETQRSAYTAQAEQIAIRRLRLENRIDLHLALGGGFGADSLRRTAANRREDWQRH